jgi:hypothetical protein
VLDLIASFEFHRILVPKQSATDNDDDTASFIESVGDALTSDLIKGSPPKTSPRKRSRAVAPLLIHMQLREIQPLRLHLLGMHHRHPQLKTHMKNVWLLLAR